MTNLRPPVILKEANSYRRRRFLDSVVALVPSAWFDETRKARLARFGVELVDGQDGKPAAWDCKWYLFGPDDWVHDERAERIGLFFGNREEVDLGYLAGPERRTDCRARVSDDDGEMVTLLGFLVALLVVAWIVHLFDNP